MVSMSGVIMTLLGGHEARVDSDEKDVEAWADIVRQSSGQNLYGRVIVLITPLRNRIDP